MGEHELLLTPSQVNWLDKAQSSGKRIHLRLSAKQVARNVSYTGGFLASIVARLLPTSSGSCITYNHDRTYNGFTFGWH